jgi:hypothetical protein
MQQWWVRHCRAQTIEVLTKPSLIIINDHYITSKDVVMVNTHIKHGSRKHTCPVLRYSLTSAPQATL